MNDSTDRLGAGRKTGTMKGLLYLLFLFIAAVLFVAGAEIILRSRGIKPWRMEEVSTQVYPGGKFFRRHPILGYSHIPGRFIVKLESGCSFNVTHLPNTLRSTNPPTINDDEPEPREEIWIFGCSFTHGWSLNDEATYPWLLQERFPEYKVVNFGVSGYGTIHSLLQFRDSLNLKTPKVVIYAYAIFHDARNTFLRIRRKNITSWNKLGPVVQPHAWLDKNDRLQYFPEDVLYTEFPLMRHLALAHFIEIKYNQLEIEWSRSHEVTEALVLEMARLAREHKIIFIVANIRGGGEAMLDFAEKHGILHVDICVDLSLPENTNLPCNYHPSAMANQKYADKLERFLRASILK